MKHFLRTFLASTLLFFPTFADPLSLDEAMELAITSDKTLKIIAGNLEISDLKIFQSYSQFLPSLSLSGSHSLNNSSPLWDSSQSVQANRQFTFTLRQPVTALFQSYFLIQKHRIENAYLTKAQELERNAARLKGAKLYLNAVKTYHVLQIASENFKTSSLQRQDAEVLLKTQELSQTEFLKFVLEEMQTKNRKESAERDYLLARQNLSVALNISTESITLPSQTSSWFEKSQISLSPWDEAEKDLKNQFSTHALLTQQQLQIRSLGYETKRELWNFLPSVSMNLGTTYSTQIQNDQWNVFSKNHSYNRQYYASLNFEWQIWNNGFDSASVAIRSKELRNKIYEHEKEKEELWNTIRSTYTQLLLYENTLKDKIKEAEIAKEIFEKSHIQFKSGDIKTFELILAQKAKFVSEENLATARIDLDLAWLEYQNLLGTAVTMPAL